MNNHRCLASCVDEHPVSAQVMQEKYLFQQKSCYINVQSLSGLDFSIIEGETELNKMSGRRRRRLGNINSECKYFFLSRKPSLIDLSHFHKHKQHFFLSFSVYLSLSVHLFSLILSLFLSGKHNISLSQTFHIFINTNKFYFPQPCVTRCHTHTHTHSLSLSHFHLLTLGIEKVEH